MAHHLEIRSVIEDIVDAGKQAEQARAEDETNFRQAQHHDVQSTTCPSEAEDAG